ncbi:MAG: glycosyltransferase family 2 protein [Gammaproteobacteria bacterium]
MKVSVLIPTFNRRDYIVQALESVLAQDYADMEIIVVDDGSTDGTEDVLKPYLSAIRYIRTPNQGPALARNVGMEAAQGEYIAYLDSDDLYYPFKTRLQAEFLDEHPDVGMVYSDFSAFSDEGFWDEFHLQTYHASAYRRGGIRYERIFSERHPLETLQYAKADAHTGLRAWSGRSVYIGEIYRYYLFNTIVFTNSLMFRRSLLKTTGLQERRFGMFHDLEFALRLCRQAKAAFIDLPTYKLRYHRGQISTLRNPERERVAIKLQRDLLRVIRCHVQFDRAYFLQSQAEIDRQLAGLCRAVALPLLAYANGTPHTDRCYPRRARRYLAKCREYGQAEPVLMALSYAPHLLRRIAFKLMEIRQNLRTRRAARAPS